MLNELIQLCNKKAQSISYLCVKLVCNERDLRSCIHKAKKDGYNVEIVDGYVHAKAKFGAKLEHLEFGERKPGRHRVALITDIHFGSKTCDRSGLSKFLKMAHGMGVRNVVCTGDICDGNKPVLIPEQNHCTFDGQADQCVQLFASAPKFDNLIYCTGNHDGYFDASMGTSSGRILQDRFTDVGVNATYLGACLGHATIEGARWQLWHGMGGAGSHNAVRRIMNTRAESFGLNPNKPQILALGHFHKFVSFTAYPEKVHCVSGGCWQKKGSEFSNRITNPWDVGGAIITWRLGTDGRVSEVSSDFYSTDDL